MTRSVKPSTTGATSSKRPSQRVPRVAGYPNDAQCIVDGCVRFPVGGWLCSLHYQRSKNDIPFDAPLRVKREPYPDDAQCAVEDCSTKPLARGWCRNHYQRWRKRRREGREFIDPAINLRRPRNSRVTFNQAGYKFVDGRGHPNANQRGYIREHVLVMSNVLGRPLLRGEQVHHINGVRDDNREENLELWSHAQPPGQRVADKVQWAKEMLALYEPEALALEERADLVEAALRRRDR